MQHYLLDILCISSNILTNNNMSIPAQQKAPVGGTQRIVTGHTTHKVLPILTRKAKSSVWLSLLNTLLLLYVVPSPISFHCISSLADLLFFPLTSHVEHQPMVHRQLDLPKMVPTNPSSRASRTATTALLSDSSTPLLTQRAPCTAHRLSITVSSPSARLCSNSTRPKRQTRRQDFNSLAQALAPRRRAVAGGPCQKGSNFEN